MHITLTADTRIRELTNIYIYIHNQDAQNFKYRTLISVKEIYFRERTNTLKKRFTMKVDT